MNILDNIIVKSIEKPFIVYSEKGRKMNIINRYTYGISLCYSGQISYTMNGKKIVSNKDNIILLPKGATYSLYGDKEGYFPVINFECENLLCNEITLLEPEDINACKIEIEKLKNLFLQNSSTLNKITSFYILLNKISNVKKANHNPLKNVEQYIADNISNGELSNTKIASELGISEIYLRKLFISHFGITPKQYIINLRIEKAKQFLTESPKSLTEISDECGFSSVYHFSRAFKSCTDVTPTQYAKQNKIFKI